MADINWGGLVPLQQMSPIQSQQVRPAQAAPIPQAPNPDQGGSGLGGLLSGLKGLFGSNPVSVANDALTTQMQNTPAPDLAKALMGASTPQSQAQGYQNNPSSQQTNSALSIPNMQAMAAQTFPNDPVRQQLALSQATQESGLLGTPSGLATQGNNLFGMKGQGNAGSLSMPTTENINGQNQKTQADFAKYKSPLDSFNAYKKLLQNPRYAGAMGADNLQGAAEAMQKGGYATDPNYAKNVVNTFNKIQTVSQAHAAPTPDIKSGEAVSQDMEKTPAFQQSMQSYAAARQSGLTKSPYVVNVDFSQPATAKRLSVVNAETGKIVYQSEVAQGSGKGFGNTPGGHQSSLGTFQTTQTYNGAHGNSLRIKGLDKGVNDNVEARDVVVHGADYIGNGKTGHSFGCFAVPTENAPKLINLIKDGTIIHAYAGNDQQQQGS